MKRFFLILTLSLTVSSYPQGDKNNNPDITSDELKSHISYLASDELKGRFSGADELKTAADYIEILFKSYGLTTLF